MGSIFIGFCFFCFAKPFNELAAFEAADFVHKKLQSINYVSSECNYAVTKIRDFQQKNPTPDHDLVKSGTRSGLDHDLVKSGTITEVWYIITSRGCKYIHDLCAGAESGKNRGK